MTIRRRREVRRGSGYLSCGKCIRGGLRVLCNAIRPGANYNTQCMRIALFCHKFWPAVGGLCTYTGRLAEYLVARGHDVRVFTARTRQQYAGDRRVSPNLLVRRFATALANHPPYHFMPGLLDARQRRPIFVTSTSFTRSDTTFSEPCSLMPSRAPRDMPACIDAGLYAESVELAAAHRSTRRGAPASCGSLHMSFRNRRTSSSCFAPIASTLRVAHDRAVRGRLGCCSSEDYDVEDLRAAPRDSLR